MKTFLIIILCLSISGCSWQRNEAMTQTDIDDAQCRAQAASLYGAPALQIWMVRQACMEGKGYK